MTNIQDWTTKAARVIHLQFDLKNIAPQNTSVPRIAAIIAQHAEPLVALLRESKREHRHCDDSWYCCGKCTSLDHMMCPGGENHEHDAACYLGAHAGEAAREFMECNCGADEWNAKVDAALGSAEP